MKRLPYFLSVTFKIFVVLIVSEPAGKMKEFGNLNYYMPKEILFLITSAIIATSMFRQKGRGMVPSRLLLFLFLITWSFIFWNMQYLRQIYSEHSLIQQKGKETKLNRILTFGQVTMAILIQHSALAQKICYMPFYNYQICIYQFFEWVLVGGIQSGEKG